VTAQLRNKLLAAGAVFCAAAGLVIIFYLRAPALLVTDPSFTAMYGIKRSNRRQTLASLVLFRRVKPVTVADGAGPDVLLVAIDQAASRPYCVLFPRRYTEAAVRFAGQFPHIPAVLLESHSTGDIQEGNLFVYSTGRETDLYRAGLCAGILAGAGKWQGEARNDPSETPAVPGKVVFFQDRSVTQPERDAFSRGLLEQGIEAPPLFLGAAAQLTSTRDVACVVLAGGTPDFPEKNFKIPLIFVTWLDPALTPRETALIFDDSPWAMAVPAFRMAARKVPSGTIPSKTLIFPAHIADNGIFQKLKKAVEKFDEKR
jgi:hypothetical protein